MGVELTGDLVREFGPEFTGDLVRVSGEAEDTAGWQANWQPGMY
jgi:hypothetical protein